MADLHEEIMEQVSAISPSPTTRDALMEYYKQRFPRDWNKHLSAEVRDHLQPDKKGRVPSEKSIARQFQKRNGRFTNPSARYSAAYEALGEEIGPQPPSGGYTIVWDGEIKISNVCVHRSFTVYVSGDEAEEFARTGDPYIVLRAYFQGLDMAEGWCGEPELHITGGGGTNEFQHGPQEPKASKFAGFKNRGE